MSLTSFLYLDPTGAAEPYQPHPYSLAETLRHAHSLSNNSSTWSRPLFNPDNSFHFLLPSLDSVVFFTQRTEATNSHSFLSTHLASLPKTTGWWGLLPLATWLLPQHLNVPKEALNLRKPSLPFTEKCVVVVFSFLFFTKTVNIHGVSLTLHHCYLDYSSSLSRG